METVGAIQDLWDFSNPKESQEKFFAFQTNDPVISIILKTQIARTKGLLREFEDGFALIKECHIETVASVVDKCAESLINLEHGRLFRSSGSPKESIEYFEKAYNVSKNDPELDYFAVDALHMLALVAEDKRQYYQTAIELTRTSSNEKTRRWNIALSNNLGWLYHDENDFENALLSFQEALKYSLDSKIAPKIVIAKWAVARCLRSLKRIDEALEIQLKLEESEKHDGYVFEELMELYALKGDDQKVKVNASKAYELLSQDTWFIENETARVNRMKALKESP